MISIVAGECNMLYYKKYGFIVCEILFDFYSAHYKVFVCLLCINKQRGTTAPLDSTHILSSRNCRTTKLYQGSVDRCKGDRNSDVIRLLQPYLTIHHFNQSVLAIVPDLNIFVFSIKIFDLISRSALVQYFPITC